MRTSPVRGEAACEGIQDSVGLLTHSKCQATKNAAEAEKELYCKMFIFCKAALRRLQLQMLAIRAESVFLLFAHRVRHFFPSESSEHHDHACNLPDTDTVLEKYDRA